jgi:DNA-binding Xre family transcriptional regulator
VENLQQGKVVSELVIRYYQFIGFDKRLRTARTKMFQNKIPELAKSKGLQNAFQLSKALGVSRATTNRLWNGDFNKIGIDTLHKLCRLFECQISDYLHYFSGN